MASRNLWTQHAELQLHDKVLVQITSNSAQLVVPYIIRKSNRPYYYYNYNNLYYCTSNYYSNYYYLLYCY